jgi:hypothetical protein
LSLAKGQEKADSSRKVRAMAQSSSGKHRPWNDRFGSLSIFCRGYEEKTRVEHSRETFLTANSGDFNTTSAGDQDES